MGNCSAQTGFVISQLILAEMRLAFQAGDLASYTAHLQDLALAADQMSKKDKKLLNEMEHQHLKLLTRVDRLAASSVALPNSSLILKRQNALGLDQP